MKFILNKFNSFQNESYLKQVNSFLSLLFFLFLFSQHAYPSILRLIFIIPAVILLFIKDEESRKYFWLLSAIICLIDVFIDYTLLSNHIFMFGYISFSLYLSYLVPKDDQEAFIKKQFLWSFAIVMFFSGLQKLLSPEFMDGSLLSYYFVQGNLGGFFLKAFPNAELGVLSNLKALLDFSNTEPANIKSIVFDPIFPLFHKYAKQISWFIVFVELGIGILIIPFLKKYFVHILILSLMLGILITRHENTFIALLSTLAFFITPKEMKTFRFIYLAFSFLCISIMVCGFGSI